MTIKTETKSGVNCSGTDGQSNRQLTLVNTGLTSDDGLLVVVGYSTLAEIVDFTIAHLSSNSVITFLNPVFDSQSIIITYQENVLAGAIDLSTVNGIAALLNESFNNIPSGISANMNYFVEISKQFVANYCGVSIDSNSIDPIYQNPIVFIAKANLMDAVSAQSGSGSIALSELNVGAPMTAESAKEYRLLADMALKNIGRKMRFARSLS
jgi:hypothetical protein